MSERNPDIGRMIEEELNKPEKPVVESGALPVDANLASTEQAVDEMIEREVSPEDLPGNSLKNIDAGEKSQDAMAAKKVADLGAKAASEVQQAFAGKRIEELGSIVGKFVEQAKGQGVDEAQARAMLKEQLGLFHDTYKEAGLDVQAAEIDAFARSIENPGEISSDAGKAFADMIDSGAFASFEDFSVALKERIKSIPGTEVNLLQAKLQERLKAEEDAIKAQQKETGLDASDEDIDDLLGGFGEQKKAS